MKAFVGITDSGWFEVLRGQRDLEEVNFWQPGGMRKFTALTPGELFLFKLHSPQNFIVGGGIFAHSTLMPISFAWSAFGRGNGVYSLEEMRERTQYYRRTVADPREDFTVGCILLTQPFFLPEARWIAVPPDWSRKIVQGRTYDLTVEPGLALFGQLQAALHELRVLEPQAPRFGDPILVRPRLGQGSFRVLVTDAYERRCSITGERVLPVLEAAHVRPYAQGGLHSIDNGLLLRSDLHTLFDRGYLTITPDLHVVVSKRLKVEYENGRLYYALSGSLLRPPGAFHPTISQENIRWHNQERFFG